MSRQIKSTTHNDDLLSGIARLRSDTTHSHRYADMLVEVGDGTTFRCHRLVLSLKAPYLEQFLSVPDGSRMANQKIFLSNVRAASFDKVLEFMYTGTTELTEDTVEDMLAAGHALRMTELSQFCVDFMLERVSAENCPRYLRLAEETDQSRLVEQCNRFCMSGIEKIASSSNSGLGRLSERVMRDLLQDDQLVLETETEACETLLKWLNFQPRKGNIVQPFHLLTCIRWSDVPLEYIKTRLLADAGLMSDHQSFQFLSNVVSYRLIGTQFSGLNTFHRSSTGVEKVVIVVGLDYGPRITSDVYRVSLQVKDHVTRPHTVPGGMNPETVACVADNQLYVTGMGSKKHETWKWEPAFGWIRCGKMATGRRRHCATFVNHTTMYVLGGFRPGKTTLSSIEQYSTVTNRWCEAGRLKYPTQSAACAVHNTLIYVFGGIGENGNDLDTVQEFDTATRVCTKLSQCLPQPERLLRTAMWENFVILINNRSCLIFDLEQQTFQERNHFSPDMIQFGLVLENQRLFIIGGGRCEARGKKQKQREWRCSDEVSSVDVMDVVHNIRTAQWQHHAKLSSPGMVHAYAAMTLPTKH